MLFVLFRVILYTVKMLFLGETPLFFDNFSKVVLKIYCAFKIEKIVNLETFVIFSFW